MRKHSLPTYAVLATALLAACTDNDAPQPDKLELPGDAYYPESLVVDDDGTLYVGSLVTGQVLAFADGETAGTVVVGASSGVTGVAGVTVRGNELWLCSIDTMFQRPTEVRSFTLAGVALKTYSIGPNRFCNDLAFDAAGALYITDSFSGTVLRLAPGGAAAEPWVEDAALAPAAQGGFGLDGLAVVAGAVFVNKFDTGGLFRIAIGAGAAAGPVQPITVTPALTAPDGMRALDDRTLLVAEGNGRLTKVVVNGATATATPLTTDLDQPTGVVVARGSAWVTEGQLGRLFSMPPQPPNLPFTIRRVDL
jgi:hypothetical protein